MPNEPFDLGAGFFVPGDWDRGGKWRKHYDTDGRPQYQITQVNRLLSRRKRQGVIIDGGAHIGLWSYHLHQQCQQVYAFEPVPEIYSVLATNAQKWPNVKIFNVALSNVTGAQVPMAPRSMGSQICKSDDPMLERWVPTMAIDSLGLAEVTCIKLDVEGHELEALEGAEKTILRWRPAIMVEDKSEIRPGNLPLKWLNRLGMQCIWSLKHDYLFDWVPDAAL